jgi:hypothetical protein
MPLLRFDIYEGRSGDQVKAMLDATHRAVVAAFGVPLRDRYQIVHERPTSHLVVEDTGLGIKRTKNCVVLQIVTRPHERREKQNFYHLLCESLKKECGIEPSDVVVSIVTNTDEDWSFGNGRAQFLTGELEGSKAPLAPINS